MATKLETFLKDKKIDHRQLLATSKQVEGLQPEDRALKLQKRRGAKAEDGDKKQVVGGKKPRSGRPVNATTLQKLLAGKPVSGPTKTRVLRAVNALLARKKQDKVELAALFDPSIAAPKKKKKEAATTKK